MPASFQVPDNSVDAWMPVPPDSPYSQSRSSTWYTTIGRLKPGVSLAQARADLALVQRRLGQQFPATDARLAVSIQPLKDTIVGRSGRSLWMLFGAVTLLLLIACTNIAALLLARATEREHELSVRFSLGASRLALISQLLTEVVVLSVLGSFLAIWIAAAAAHVFRSEAGQLPRAEEVVINWRIAAYCLACSTAAGFVCGILPAWRFTRKGIAGSLASNGRSQVSARGRMQWVLVGVQAALAVVLLAGAGLLLRSFQQLARVAPGFDPSHVLTLHVSASYGETADMKALTQHINRVLDALRATPGVEAAATSLSLPGIPSEFPAEVKILEGESDPNRKILADNRFVSPGYFATMRIPLFAGEPCRDSLAGTEAVVNRSFVSQYFAGTSALGHHLQASVNPQFPLFGEVRGIVGDAREQGLNRAPMPTVYWCMSAPVPDPNYLIRTRGEPMAMAGTLRRVIHQIEPVRSVFGVMPLPDHLSQAFAENRLRTILLSLFALTALALACIGLYGMLSYVVGIRRREVGLRLALGAPRGQIVLRFLFQGLRVCAVGCLAGIALAIPSDRLLTGMLYGVSPYDSAILSGVTAALLLVAGAAALLPALRAARTDPMCVLREE